MYTEIKERGGILFDVLLGLDGDLVIRDGDIVLTENVQQAIKIRLRWFLNEWRFNTSFGMPYYEQVFIKGFNLGLIEQAFKQQIKLVDEVLDVLEMKLIVDYAQRELKVTYKVKLSNEILEGEENVYG